MIFSELLSELLAREGLWRIVMAALAAGLVRGFSGFGSGLVFLPIAGGVLSPPEAVAALVLMDLIGPLGNLPGALRTGSMVETRRLFLGLLFGLPIGMVALFWISPEPFRWIISLVALATVGALVAGWRWQGARSAGATASVGFIAGLLGGSTGVPAPPVVLYYMSSTLPVAVIRANLTLFMIAIDLVMGSILIASGRIELGIALLGLALVLPFSLANAVGSALFRPDRAGLYKALSWGLIAASALVGLPLWGH